MKMLSYATVISGAAFLAAGLSALATETMLIGQVFAGLWLLSIPALLVAVTLDVVRKRYWALAVLPLVFVIGVAGAVFIYLHSSHFG